MLGVLRAGLGGWATLLLLSPVTGFYIPGMISTKTLADILPMSHSDRPTPLSRLVDKELQRRRADPATSQQGLLGQHPTAICLL